MHILRKLTGEVMHTNSDPVRRGQGLIHRHQSSAGCDSFSMRYNTKMENMTQGDWQVPAVQAPKKSKFIIITVVVLAVVAAGAFLATQYKKQEVAPTRPGQKVYTTEEKTKILQALSTTQVAQPGSIGSPLSADGTPKPVAQVTKERTQILQSLSATAPKPATTLTDEQKQKILNALSR